MSDETKPGRETAHSHDPVGLRIYASPEECPVCLRERLAACEADKSHARRGWALTQTLHAELGAENAKQKMQIRQLEAKVKETWALAHEESRCFLVRAEKAEAELRDITRAFGCDPDAPQFKWEGAETSAEAVATLRERLAELERESELWKHRCACAVDGPDDVCLTHSPHLNAARARAEKAEGDARRLAEALTQIDDLVTRRRVMSIRDNEGAFLKGLAYIIIDATHSDAPAPRADKEDLLDIFERGLQGKPDAPARADADCCGERATGERICTIHAHHARAESAAVEEPRRTCHPCCEFDDHCCVKEEHQAGDAYREPADQGQEPRRGEPIQVGGPCPNCGAQGIAGCCEGGV